MLTKEQIEHAWTLLVGAIGDLEPYKTIHDQAVLAISLAAENERLKNAAELKAKTEASVNPVVNSYVHELLATIAALKDGIRDWAHDYGFDHDDKAMQEIEAIIDGTADKEAN